MPLVEMDPPIGQSVTYTGPDRWAMGNLYFCEKVTGPAPTDAVATWKDGESTFTLRPQPENHSQIPGDTETTRIVDMGTRLGEWSIGESTNCKVASWVEGMEVEGDTIRAVRESMPSIPIPEVIHYWIDRAWNRTFLLRKPPSGETLEDAWPKLSKPQIAKVAADVAKLTVTMSEFTSPELKTINGCGVNDQEYLLHGKNVHTWPSWKPYVYPIYTPETFMAHLRGRGGPEPPAVGNKFHFYNTLMTPLCIYVSVSGPGEEDVRVTGLFDWDGACYVPHWFPALMPMVCNGFALGSGLEPAQWVWKEMLGFAIFNEGFPCPFTWYLDREGFRYDREHDGPQRMWPDGEIEKF